MITKHDLEEAIAECQGKRNPDANTCLKLAAFYTIRKELFEKEEKDDLMYSYASAPEPEPEPIERMNAYGDSEFLSAVSGKSAEGVMSVMDELMDAMKVLQPRIYDSVMRKVMSL